MASVYLSVIRPLMVGTTPGLTIHNLLVCCQLVQAVSLTGIYFVCFVCNILTSLFSTCRPYRDRQRLLIGHDALLLRQIARDLLHALSNRHDSTWTAFGEPVVGTGGEKLTFCSISPF